MPFSGVRNSCGSIRLMLSRKSASFFSGFLPDGLGFFQARFDRCIKGIDRKWLGQVIIRAQFHAVAHSGAVRQAGHQDERDGGRGRLVAQRRQVSNNRRPSPC